VNAGRQKSFRIIAALAIPLLLLLNPNLWDLSNKSVRYDLEAIGSSIYEFHNLTGEWPQGADDLARTSLPLKVHHWRYLIQAGNVVVIWNRDLLPDPGHNANRVLVYHNQGLLAAFGHKWACWGDLRTEYASNAKIRSAMAQQ
jgi:hypothetical protein